MQTIKGDQLASQELMDELQARERTYSRLAGQLQTAKKDINNIKSEIEENIKDFCKCEDSLVDANVEVKTVTNFVRNQIANLLLKTTEYEN